MEDNKTAQEVNLSAEQNPEPSIDPMFVPSPIQASKEQIDNLIRKDRVTLAEELSILQQKYDIIYQALGVRNYDFDQAKKELTKDSIKEILFSKGYGPVDANDRFYFKVKGRYRFIYIGQLPRIAIGAEFPIEDNNEVEIIKKVAYRITSKNYLVKAYVRNDNKTLVIRVDAYEPKLSHFRESIDHYLMVVNDGHKKLWELKEQEKLIDKVTYAVSVRREKNSSIINS